MKAEDAGKHLGKGRGFDPQQLAHELHDGVIQEVSAIVLRLETYQRRLNLDPQAAEEDLISIKGQAREALRTLRALSARLRQENQRENLG